MITRQEHDWTGQANRSLLGALLLLPFLFVSCGSVFQGPVFGSITLERPADAGDAVVFLRCRGGGFHGEIQTDAEQTRVAADGRFRFLGSLTFPTTEKCRIEVRHPRYQTVRVELEDVLVQEIKPIALTSWDRLFEAGPDHALDPGSRYPWPQSEVSRHLSDTLMWLRSFTGSERLDMVRYVPDIHDIYRQAFRRLAPGNKSLRDMLRRVAMIEEQTAYPYPFGDYLQAVTAGDAPRVQAFIDGGVLRETYPRGQSSTLRLAAAGGHLDVIEVLLAHNEPLNIAGCGAPLLAAISERQWPAALELIRQGANSNVGCQDRRPIGDTLTNFSRQTRLVLLAEFLDAGVPADTRNSGNTTALVEATAGGHIQSVKVLLAGGANPDVRTADGLVLIDEAKSRGYLDIERELRLAMAAGHQAQWAAGDAGETISLPWRRGDAANYRVYSSYDQVNDIVADPVVPGVLWLATQGGLLRLNPETGTQRNWGRVHGLPANAVQDLWFDTIGGYLWVSTAAGLARLRLDDLGQVETVGSGEPRSGHASGFLRGESGGAVWYWSRGLFRLEAENSQARRYTFDQTPHGAVVIPGSPDFFISDNRGLWRFDAVTGRRERVIDSEELVSRAGGGPPGRTQLLSLAIDVAHESLWMGSQRHGVFRLDIDSGSIDRQVLTQKQISRCARSSVSGHMYAKVVHVGGQIFVQFDRCFGRIDDNNRLVVMREAVDAGPVADTDGNIWFLAEGYFHRLDASGGHVEFARRPSQLEHAKVNAIHRTGGRLFMGVEDATLTVLDLEQRTWSRVTGVTNIQRLRSVAGGDDLLALGKARYYWVNPTTLASRELALGPASSGQIPGSQWRDLRDLEFDGETMWVLRDNKRRRAGKSRSGLYRLWRDGFERYDSASGYSLGELTRVLQDPSHSGRLWLVRKRDSLLVDFDKSSLESELVSSNGAQRRNSDLLATAMADPRLKKLTIRPHEALDPDAPELVWGVRGTGLYLKRGPVVIHRWPAKLPVGQIEIIRETETTVWIATGEGLIEFPISESLAELQQAAGTSK